MVTNTPGFFPIQKYTVANFFSLEIRQKMYRTNITMQLTNDQVTTAMLPAIVSTLTQHLPSVLQSRCFNKKRLPFHIEVQNTETGHLFEHILLAYLCQLKIEKGYPNVIFNGRTSWNWARDPRGKFHIKLDCGIQDVDILLIAIEKTITLMKILFLHHSETQTNHSSLTPQVSAFPFSIGIKNGKISPK